MGSVCLNTFLHTPWHSLTANAVYAFIAYYQMYKWISASTDRMKRARKKDSKNNNKKTATKHVEVVWSYQIRIQTDQTLNTNNNCVYTQFRFPSSMDSSVAVNTKKNNQTEKKYIYLNIIIVIGIISSLRFDMQTKRLHGFTMRECARRTPELKKIEVCTHKTLHDESNPKHMH